MGRFWGIGELARWDGVSLGGVCGGGARVSVAFVGRTLVGLKLGVRRGVQEFWQGVQQL